MTEKNDADRAAEEEQAGFETGWEKADQLEDMPPMEPSDDDPPKDDPPKDDPRKQTLPVGGKKRKSAPPKNPPKKPGEKEGFDQGWKEAEVGSFDLDG